jgi:serine/threonine protein kinase
LEKIASLKDDHLVQIIKTYQLGDKYNILFPCAKTNLYNYLREEEWRAPQHVSINQNPMWQQVLGITVALSKIINFPDPEDPQNVIFGYHLDLKPQNILIDSSGPGRGDIFKITDFGQARFVNKAFAGTSRIKGGGGTDIYAPPEYLEYEQDRAYDVWSLGIIVMEVLAYAVRGVAGLKNPANGLDAARLTREGNFTHSRFYTTTGTNVIIKPSIVSWTKELLQDPVVGSKDNQEFVHALIQLVWKMLEPRMKRRITIDKVVKEMAKIFEMKASDDDEVTTESLKQKDEEVLIDLKSVIHHLTFPANQGVGKWTIIHKEPAASPHVFHFAF